MNWHANHPDEPSYRMNGPTCIPALCADYVDVAYRILCGDYVPCTHRWSCRVPNFDHGLLSYVTELRGRDATRTGGDVVRAYDFLRAALGAIQRMSAR